MIGFSKFGDLDMAMLISNSEKREAVLFVSFDLASEEEEKEVSENF